MHKGRCSVDKQGSARDNTRDKGERNENLFETLLEGIGNGEKIESVVEILRKYSDVFSKQRDDIGHFGGLQHDIEVYNKRPIYARPFKIPNSVEEEVEKKIMELVKNGILKECCSPWNFPLLPIRKKSGDIRLCVDYRRLNDITIKKVFPMPDHQQIIDCLHGAKYFSTLDLSQGYYQISLQQEDQLKSAFTVKSGQYCFTRMPFGLTNAPCTFQRALNSVMRNVSWKKCVIFMDDILIFGKTLNEHNQNLQSVLKVLKANDLKAMPTKCSFLKSEVQFLGHIISAQGVKTDPKKIEAMEMMDEPTNVKQLRRFLGTVNYYKKFIKDFSKIAYPLYNLTSPKKVFEWKEEHKRAFNQLKEKMLTPPVLCFPNRKDKFILYTDASEYAIGSVLCQLQEDGEKIIAYGSRKLSASELNYSVTKKELLSIVTFVRQFKNYLWGVEFEIRTDHKSLQYVLRGTNNTASQFCRWRTELDMYNFQIRYIKGTGNTLADGMSRPQKKAFQATIDVGTRNSYYDDDNINTVINLLQQARLNDKSPKELRSKNYEAKILWARREELELKGNKLFLRKGDTTCLVLPPKYRMETVRNYHQDHCHIGIQKTLSLIKMRFFWTRMEETVKDVINSCHLCSFNKQPSTRNKAPLISTLVGEPFERIAIDLTGPFTVTSKGNRYIFGIIDHFSKFTMLIPVKNLESKTICNALFDHWVSLFGAPIEIISDNGSSFKNKLKTGFANMMGIKEIFSPPYYPQANGLVERLFRTAKIMIKLAVTEHRKEWDEVLPSVNMALRNSIAHSTNYAPYEVIFGKRARLPMDWQFPEIQQRAETGNDYIIELKKRLNCIGENVKKNLEMSILKQADYYNKNKLAQNLRIGDLVLVRQTRNRCNGNGLKKYMYCGPYEIIKKLGEWTYELQERNTNEKIRRSYNQIKKFGNLGEEPNRNVPIETHETEERVSGPEPTERFRSQVTMRDRLNASVEQQQEWSEPQDITPQTTAIVEHQNLRRSTREKKQPDRFGFPEKAQTELYR